MIWKDYLYFTRAQRNGIKIMMLLLILVASIPRLAGLLRVDKEYDTAYLIAQIADFEERLSDRGQRDAHGNSSWGAASGRQYAEHAKPDDGSSGGSSRIAEKRSYSGSKSGTSGSSGSTRSASRERVVLSPRLFNPNNLAVEQWESMGLPSHVVRTIKNFEAAGGSFRFREDVQRIYLMEEDWYTQLEPYIELPSRHETIPRGETILQEEIIPGGETISRGETSATERQLVDINRADTTELVGLRGIGQVFARRIAEYRNQLGGFVHAGQLLEVFGMDSARLEQFLPDIVIDTTAIKRISLREADFITLVRHPYIDRNLANAIIAFRDQHQPLDSVGQLRQSFLISDAVYDKISPYMMAD